MSWAERPYRLRFRFGQFELAGWNLRALWLQKRFHELLEDPETPPIDFAAAPRGVQLMLLRSLPVKERLPRLTLLPEAIRYVPSQFDRHYADLTGSFDDYMKHFSSKSRSTLLRKVRKFAEFSGGQIRWREFRAPEEAAEFHRLATVVSDVSYQERLLGQGLPRSEQFKALLADQATRDAMRGYILFSGERPIAYLYCPIANGTLAYQYLGFDPEFHSWSPGMVLQHLVFERLFQEGRHKRFDFLEGEGQHKTLFGTHSVFCADVMYFRPTLFNRLLVRAHAAVSDLSAWTGRTLASLNLKGAIKKLTHRTG